MKKVLILLISILIIFVLIDINFLHIANEELKEEKGVVVESSKELTGRLNECRKYNNFLSALDEIGTIPYDSEFNNCYDHAKELQIILADDYDIESSIMINENRTHAWLAVWVESTTGHFIKTDNNFNILEVRDRDLKVICN